MFADIRTNPQIAKNCYTIDLTTNKFIDRCIWSNDVTGEYCVYVVDKDGNLIKEWGDSKYKHIPVPIWETKETEKYGEVIVKQEIKKGQIKIVHLTDNESHYCSKCHSLLKNILYYCKKCHKLFESNILVAEHYVKECL